jgi:hypothetical protein
MVNKSRGTGLVPCGATGEDDRGLKGGENRLRCWSRSPDRTHQATGYWGTQSFDPQWKVPSLVEKNPPLWMAEVNDLLVDLRDMPREVQEIAFGDGLIPHIPADRKERS